MNKDLFDSMQKQMRPSPEVRAALDEKLARPAKRRIPIRKYAAIAACAVLVVGIFPVYSLCQDQEKWILIIRSFNRYDEVPHYHSYVTVEDSTTTDTGALIAENGVEVLYHPHTVDRNSGAPNTGDLSRPEGAVIQDVPVQEGAEDYQLLMTHFNGTLPDWYGGGYLDGDGRLVVLLTQIEDSVNNPLKLQIQEWAGSDRIRFGSAKYSLNHLKGLMDRLNRLPDADLKYSDVMAGWGIDEEHNRVELTLTQVYEPLLAVLAELDPDDDAIYVQIGQRITLDVAADDMGEDLTVMPGGAVIPEYGVEDLPERKQPAVQSVPEEDVSASSCNPDR